MTGDFFDPLRSIQNLHGRIFETITQTLRGLLIGQGYDLWTKRPNLFFELVVTFPATSPRTENRSGNLAIMSNVLAPMEPVDPRIMICFIMLPS